MRPHITNAPWWTKWIYVGASITMLLMAPLYWRIHFSTAFCLYSLAFSSLASIWITRRIWAANRSNDPRDLKRTWISKEVRKSVLRKELLELFFVTAFAFWLCTLLVAASTLALRPVETRTAHVLDVDICRRKCGFCRNHARVILWPGTDSALCADDVDPPLTDNYTALVKGRFTPYVGFVMNLRRGPTWVQNLMELIKQEERSSRSAPPTNR